ncbi:protein SHQ1 homolog [Oratosquilla oratoria]|uniref:protein SHQ1 homolog n=1 Tax=Oratosquilla oratoria TaxID=337810 RepID=UPI003F76FFC3
MLTPRFTLTQDSETVTINIKAPFARVSDAEVNVDDESFTFYASPYYLRLTLPGKLVDSEQEKHKAHYDADSGVFVITCQKQTPGENFQGLDMLTSLLTPPGTSGVNKPLIEVIGGDDQGEALLGDESDDMEDWYYEQHLPEENTVILSGQKYGFAGTHSGVFSSLRSELIEVVDVKDPDSKSVSVRRAERNLKELEAFNEDHYLADYFDKDGLEPYLSFTPAFTKLQPGEVKLNDEEQEALLKLPRKEFLMDKEARSFVYLSLVDLIYCWCYNHRITLGENCSESSWNIAKLSSTLTWLDSFTHVRDVVCSCVRRSLIFPLVRNWDLTTAVLKDTAQILSLGRNQVLKCLLEIQKIFSGSEVYYLLNQLYITDYCIWIQRVKNNKLTALADSVRKVKLSKNRVGLELEELEAAGHLVLEEEEEDEDNEETALLCNHMDQLTIIPNAQVQGLQAAGTRRVDSVGIQIRNVSSRRRQDSSSSTDSSSSSSSNSSSSNSSNSSNSSTSSSSSSSSDSSDESSDKSSNHSDDTSDSSEIDSDDDTLSGEEN